MATLWQYAHLWITDRRSAPAELMRPYPALGYKVVEVHLQDAGEVPWSWCEQMRSAGFAAVMGAFWPNPADPVEDARWAVAEAKRLVLKGIIVNAEDPIEAEDSAGHRWSARFCEEFRRLAPTLGLAINTYSECGYIAHDTWRAAKARLYVQTGRAGAPFAEPVPFGMAWAQAVGWTKARIKPCFGVYKDSDGNFPDPAAMIASAKQAGSIGFSAYYADGADLGEPAKLLKPLSDGIGPTGIAR